MSTPTPQVFYGNAYGWAPKGFPSNWQRQSSLRRRAEENGGDVVRGGYAPVGKVVTIELLAADVASCIVFIRRWEELAGTVGDWRHALGIPWTMPGVWLKNATVLDGPKRIHAATDGVTNYVATMQLVVARVATVTPT